jgi:sortase A
MRKRIGIFCILLGIACLLASAGFVIYNSYESQSGAQYSRTLLQVVQDKMEETALSEAGHTDLITEELPPADPQKTEPREMATIQAGDYASIGILAIPVLEVELPVLTDWSYEKLKKAPCHYYGSCYESNFVIAAHNYASHFGRLNQLQTGDLVLFTDVAGQTHYYEVVLLETLPPTATEEMITSGFALSLYTCTPGGSNRVTVRCNTANK